MSRRGVQGKRHCRGAGGQRSDCRDAGPIEGSTIDAGGIVSVTASGTSEINTIALGVGASGKTAVGAAGAVNVITNTMKAEIRLCHRHGRGRRFHRGDELTDHPRPGAGGCRFR
jgi:hypothetical protein